MTWFKYFKNIETVSSNSVNNNYSYPYSKRFINTFTPRDTIPKDFWLFLNIKNYNINKYQTSSVEIDTDEYSYLVIYEKNNEFTPVKTVIKDDYLYFQTAEEHQSTEETEGRYAIYYNTPNIRKIKSVNNGQILDYQISTTTYPYASDYADVVDESYEIDLNSDSSYNFSFINGLDHWNNGISEKPGSKVYMSFSGPRLSIYGSRGPSSGKFKMRIIALVDASNPLSKIAIEPTIIDTYNSIEEEDYKLFEIDSLEERDHIVEIEVIHDKNILSSSNKIQFSYYTFLYNVYLSLNKELLNQLNNSFTLIAGIR